MNHFDKLTTSKVLISGAFVLGCAFGCSGGRAVAAPGGPSGDAVLRKSATRYASLKAYRGRTDVRKHFVADRRVSDDKFWANIRFSRPASLTIQGKMRSGSYKITSNGRGAVLERVAFGRKSTERTASAELAVSAMAGVGGSAPTVIPAVLLKWRQSNPLAAVSGARLEGQEKVGGASCYRVSRAQGQARQTFWIDTKTYLMRRYRFTQSRDTSAMRLPGAQMGTSMRIPRKLSLTSEHTFTIYAAR